MPAWTVGPILTSRFGAIIDSSISLGTLPGCPTAFEGIPGSGLPVVCNIDGVSTVISYIEDAFITNHADRSTLLSHSATDSGFLISLHQFHIKIQYTLRFSDAFDLSGSEHSAMDNLK